MNSKTKQLQYCGITVLEEAGGRGNRNLYVAGGGVKN